jgi:hypothetical protein
MYRFLTKERDFSGAISGDVYKEYLRSGNGQIFVPLLLLFVVTMQGITVMSSYWCVMGVHAVPNKLNYMQACLLARKVCLIP